MWTYRKRLSRDLDRWQAEGWVTAQGAAAIRNDADASGLGLSLPTALGILAAVLIGFSIMSFVGANWQEIPRIVRLGMLFSALVGAYGAAGLLFTRRMEHFGHAMVLLGTALFGACIMLISQMYHMEGNPANAVLVWAIGTLLAGVAVRSNPALAFAMVLFSMWGWIETADRFGVYWPYLLGWGSVAAALYWQRWKPGVHLGGFTLTVFIVSLGYLLNKGHAHPLVALIGFALVGLSIVGERLRPDLTALWPGMLGYAVVVAFAGLFAMQFVENPDLGQLVLLAIMTLIGLLAAIWWGLTSGHRGVLWLGYIGFSIEILAIYTTKFGTLLDTSLFFLVAGLIVAGLAYLAYRIHIQRGKSLEALS